MSGRSRHTQTCMHVHRYIAAYKQTCRHTCRNRYTDTSTHIDVFVWINVQEKVQGRDMHRPADTRTHMLTHIHSHMHPGSRRALWATPADLSLLPALSQLLSPDSVCHFEASACLQYLREALGVPILGPLSSVMEQPQGEPLEVRQNTPFTRRTLWLSDEPLDKDSRPCLVSLFQSLVRTGENNWSLPELVHAVVLLAHYHALASFVFGSGINPERDPEVSDGFRLISVNSFCGCDVANDNSIENSSLTDANFRVCT